MPDPELGALIVRGRHLLGFADSSDADTTPDLGVALGTVIFESSLQSSVGPLRHLPTGTLVTPVRVTATIRTDGRVVAPANGISGAPSAADLDVLGTPDPVVRLIAPQQDFDVQDWEWTATFKPTAEGPTFAQFTRVFSGAPGELVDLSEARRGNPTTGLLQVIVFDVAAGPDGKPLKPYPDGFRPGIDLLLTPDMTLWKDDEL